MAHNPQNMPYIYHHSGNQYTYGENLQHLFTDIARDPYKNHPRTRAWLDEVVKKNGDYHREDILDRGRTNFDKLFNGLSPEDKVLLYCRYYMLMHLISSYHIFVHTSYFSDFVTSASERIVFIDIGCGPLTSGIAFWAFAQQSNTIYLGIDSSQAMRKKARRINHYGPNHDDGDPFFNRYVLTSSYTNLPEILDNTIMRGDRTPIIFNLCYFLAGKRLSVSALSDVMVQIIERYSNHEMCIVYQNPCNYPSLHKNWNILKTHLPGFRSQINQSNIQYFGYDRLTDGTRRPKASVYYDMLFNNLNSTKGGQTNDTTQSLISF